MTFTERGKQQKAHYERKRELCSKALERGDINAGHGLLGALRALDVIEREGEIPEYAPNPPFRLLVDTEHGAPPVRQRAEQGAESLTPTKR